jgi:hypothetical protein
MPITVARTVSGRCPSRVSTVSELPTTKRRRPRRPSSPWRNVPDLRARCSRGLPTRRRSASARTLGTDGRSGEARQTASTATGPVLPSVRPWRRSTRRPRRCVLRRWHREHPSRPRDLISFELTAATGKLDLYRVLYAGTEVYTSDIDTAFLGCHFIRADARVDIHRRVDAMPSHQLSRSFARGVQRLPRPSHQCL